MAGLFCSKLRPVTQKKIASSAQSGNKLSGTEARLCNPTLSVANKSIPAAMSSLSAEERIALIRENLAEMLNPEIIEKILAEGRNPKIYWGEQVVIQVLKAFKARARVLARC